MHTQLIVCDEISFDIHKKKHVLGLVINQIKVQVLPSVVSFSYLLKITNMPINQEVLTEMKVVNSRQEILGSTTYYNRNYRTNSEIPGVDQNYDIDLLVEETGPIFLECYINDNKMNWYPIDISFEDGYQS
ncbi:hypothetical protein [Paenibacillus sp. Leaf72]|uniref:hypothetical protein n=1 Tax=Paenibacillus sp. Leaf72 TaxID=1736234 RepID=UPI0006FC72AE|nr:hypothetical protein [Paenibacillus sp. Leaf72]KQO10863.1 hypothetical protein ASF12_10795 [Paenibacillus sp. Leaf72]